MHVLVTGGAGFIGSHLVEYHLAKGDHVHAVDNLSTGTLENIAPFENNPFFRFENENILTWSHMEKAVTWADRVYHMAAVVGMYRVLAEPIEVLAINITGCERVLRAAAAGGWKPRIILASSSEVYGPDHPVPLKEDDALNFQSGAVSRWNYAISKITNESYGLSYARKLHIPVTLIRLFNTIGPRQTGRYGMVVPRFVSQAVKGEPIVIYGDGKQTRTFCDVRDMVVMLDEVANNTKSIGQIVNVGGEHETSILQLAETVKQCAKSASQIKNISYEEAYGEYFEEILRRKPDLTKLYQLIPYKPKWTLERTIMDLIERSK